MTTMEQSSHVKFTVLPKSSVSLYAESVGCSSLDDNVLASLSEDVTYRLRETIQNVVRIMRHSKRRCMTTEDFNKALKWSSTQPTYGHNGVDVAHFKSLSFKEKVISYIEDKDVGLRESAFDQTLPADPGEVSIKAQWLVFEGHNCTGGKANRDEVNKKDVLEEPYSSFLEQTISAVFGKNVKARKIAIENLRASNKLQYVLPYLITFLASQVKACNGNDTLKNVARGSLLIVQALVDNIALYLVPYLLQMVKLLLFIITEGHLPVSLWECKVIAARILTQLCRRHISSNSYLPHQILRGYQECLHDDSKSLGSIYGAAFGISCLGTEVVHQMLQTVLIKKCEQLKKTIDSSSDISIIQECLMVYGLLQDISLFLLRSTYLSPVSNTTKTNSRSSSSLSSSSNKYFSLYDELLDIFDEGIVALTHFPNVYSCNARAFFQQSLLLKQQRSVNLKSRSSSFVQNSDPKSLPSESPESKKARLDTKKTHHRIAVRSSLSNTLNNEFDRSNIETSVGSILTRMKRRSWKRNQTLIAFQQVESESNLASQQTRATKRCRVSKKDMSIHDQQSSKQSLSNGFHSHNIGTTKIPRSNFSNLAKIPVTVNIFW